VNGIPISPLSRIFVTYIAVGLLSNFFSSLYGQVGGEETYLYQLSGVAPDNHFGKSVAGVGDLDGDGMDDFMVGADYFSRVSLNYAGSVRVYSGGTGAIIYQFYGSAYADFFGASVANAGDVNGDGINDLIIGASGGLGQSGYVKVYSGATGSLLHHFLGPHAGSRFGISVSSAGDLDQDGYSDLLIGASFANSPVRSSVGGVYVYSGGTGNLLANFWGLAASDYFGASVANAGDVNGDGINDILVGAYGVRGLGGISQIGAAYVFSGANGFRLWEYRGGNGILHLGASVAGLGDINNDGFDDVILGAPVSGSNAMGAAMVYSGATREKLYHFTGNVHSGNLGRTVAGVGDIDGDTTPDFVIGAADAGAWADPDGGTALLCSGSTGEIVHRFFGGVSGGQFASSVGAAGDVNGDGHLAIIVGAELMSPGGLTYAGAAYVIGFHPFLTSASRSVSAAVGGLIHLELDFPDLAAGDEYKVLMSARGVGPTTYGVEVPLTQDSLVIDTFMGNYPMSVYTGLHGTLSGTGDAAGSFTLFAGLLPNLIGRTFWLAAIANQPGQLPEYSSVAIPVKILP